MHGQRCDHCGQVLTPVSGAPEAAYDVSFDSDHVRIDDNLEGESSPPARLRSRVVVVVLALLLVALVASLAFVDRGSGPGDDQPTTLADQALADGATVGAGATSSSVGDSLGTGQGTSGDRSPTLPVDPGAWFWSEVDGDSGRYAILYPGVDGLRVLNADGLGTIDAQDAIGFQDAFGFSLFTDGQQTWGVNPDDPFDTYIVSRNYEIVDMGFEGAVAFANYDTEPVSVGISSFGGWGGGVELPLGTETLAVQGLGLLVLPKTGGTFILTGKGLESFSPDRIVAGTGTIIIAQRCDLDLVCGLFLSDGPEQAGVELPVPLGASLVPSPSGDWVLVSESGIGSRIVQVSTGADWPLSGGSIDVASWSPDNRFVSWLSGGSLHVAFPEVQRQSTLSLPSVPSSPTMIVTSG